MIGWCEALTTWWELLIPVGAAIAGSAVTGFVQSMTIRDQRRSERALRFLDERQESYARFLRLTQGFINLIEKLDSTDRKLKAAERNTRVVMKDFTLYKT